MSSADIPYEIRRHPIRLLTFHDVVYHQNTFYTHKNEYPAAKDRLFFRNVQNMHFKNQIPAFKLVLPMDSRVYLFFGNSLDNFGHFIIDNLIPVYKACVLTQKTHAVRKQELLYSWRVPRESDAQQHIRGKQKQLFSAFGLYQDHMQHAFQSPVRFRELIIVQEFWHNLPGKIDSDTRWTRYQVYDEAVSVRFLREFVQSVWRHFKIAPFEARRVMYQTRKHARWRRVNNEDSLISVCMQNGIPIERFTPEQCSMHTEIKLLYQTKVLVAPYGAGLASALFMQPGSVCIVLMPRGFQRTCDFPTIYRTFANRLGIRWIELETELVDRNRGEKNLIECRDTDMFLDAPKILKLIRRFCGNNDAT